MITHIPIDGPVGSAQGEGSQGSAPASLLPVKAREVLTLASGEDQQGNPRTQHSTGACNYCVHTLHEMANTITAMLLNAQVMEWRLPPYSRLKRPAREIERQAQRSSTLLKRLQCHLESANQAIGQSHRQAPSMHGTPTLVTTRGPETSTEGPEKLPAFAPSPSVAASWFPPEKELTRPCDPCTSAFFPKEER